MRSASASNRTAARLTLLLSSVCLCLCLWFSMGTARAQAGTPFGVRSAYMQLVDGVYMLDARLSLPIDPRIRTVLKDGVALRLELQIEMTRPRSYWLDEGIASLVQKYELKYHTVSDRYVVRNTNSGEQSTFPDFEQAVDSLTRIHNLPVIDQALIREKKIDSRLSYDMKMRLVTDVGDTPAALRLVMFWADDWHRVSEWYPWSLKP